jgi:dTDP-4-amino-4,6-dideoxygalactose transaminase
VPISRQPALASESPAACPVADRVAAEVLSLPLRPGLSIHSVVTIAAALHEFHAAV